MVSGFVSDKNKTKAVQYKLSGHNSSALSSETVPAGQTECRENYGQMPHAMLKNTAQAEKYRAKPLTSQQTQTTMNTEANRKTEWVVGIGEALWDILPEGRKIGGAPANFAYHMSQFGLRSCAVSAVGDDEAGRELRNQLREKGVGHMLETVPFPTGTVEVTLDGAGIPSYEIRQGVAWDNIPFTPQIEELARHTRAACFGSLAQRSPVSHRTIGRFLETMPDGEGQYKVFDINLRQHFYTQQVVEESLRKCNILKINDEELAVVGSMFGLEGMQPGEQRNARIDVENAQLTRERLEQSLRANLSNFWQAYRNNLEVIQLEKENLIAAKENYEIAMERYLLGDLPGIEMREAQKSLLDAEERILTAKYNTKVCEISLQQISGNVMTYME